MGLGVNRAHPYNLAKELTQPMGSLNVDLDQPESLQRDISIIPQTLVINQLTFCDDIPRLYLFKPREKVLDFDRQITQHPL